MRGLLVLLGGLVGFVMRLFGFVLGFCRLCH